MCPYDDGKAPRYKLNPDMAKNVGATCAEVVPGEGSVLAGSPRDPVGPVERPTPRGTGLFKAKGCVGHG